MILSLSWTPSVVQHELGNKNHTTICALSSSCLSAQGRAAPGPVRSSEIFQERVEAAARATNMYGGPILGERVEMTPLPDALPGPGPQRGSTDQSHYDPDQDCGGARAKLLKPKQFKGDYSEV
eukprot:3940269-Rhodomonas_salina.1